MLASFITNIFSLNPFHTQSDKPYSQIDSSGADSLICPSCKLVFHCGQDCHNTALAIHQAVCSNSSLIPKDDDKVCIFKNRDEIKYLTNREFKQLTGTTYCAYSFFTKEASVQAKNNWPDFPLTNPPHKIPTSVAITKTEKMGIGLVALKDIPRGKRICNFGGIVTGTKDVVVPTSTSLNIAVDYFGLNADPSDYASLGAFVNDGPPNCALSLIAETMIYPNEVTVPGYEKLISSRKIRKGESIYIDYGAAHSIKRAPYVLEQEGLKMLIERYSKEINIALLNKTSCDIPNDNFKEDDDVQDEALNIEYLLNTPFALAALHLCSNLDPANTSKEFEKLNEKLKTQFEVVPILLNGLIKLKAGQKEAEFFEIAKTISQQSMIFLCDALAKGQISFHKQQCQKLGKAFDCLIELCHGSVMANLWLTSEKRTFAKKFHSDEHSQQLEDNSVVAGLPKNYQECYFYWRKQFRQTVIMRFNVFQWAQLKDF